MKQQEIAALFKHMADLLEFRGANPFRIRAYRRAAMSLDGFGGDVDRLVQDGRVRAKIPGVGEDLAAKIAEYCGTGRIREIEREGKAAPKGLFDLLAVPGIGPKTARLLSDRLKITSVDALERAAKAHRLQELPGFHERKEQNVLRGVAILRGGRERMHLGVAVPQAEELVAFLKNIRGVERASAAGSLRRMRETIGDLDLLVATRQPARVMRAFTRAPFCAKILAAGETKASIVTPQGLQVDLRVVPPESYGAALQYFTGSKEHNVRLRELASRHGLKINEYGVFRLKTNRRLGGGEEADIYQAVGLPWIPPELREDRGEIAAAQANRLPRLVERKDLRGDFHLHSTWSDGGDSLEAMARAAAARGYEYAALCDHSQSLKVAHGMTVARLKQQAQKIGALNQRFRNFRLLMGSEVDILADGRMDYPSDILAKLDFVVGSVHSGFSRPQAEQTRRIERAMENPYVTVVGHPTGRLMGQREAYAVDLERLFRTAKATGTAMEINGQPKRLDLNDAAAHRARGAGVMLTLATDSHSVAQLEQVVYGLAVARRAWLEPGDLLNTKSLKELLAWIGRKRSRTHRRTT